MSLMSNIVAAHLCTGKWIKQVVKIIGKVCHGASSSHQVVLLMRGPTTRKGHALNCDVGRFKGLAFVTSDAKR